MDSNLNNKPPKKRNRNGNFYQQQQNSALCITDIKKQRVLQSSKDFPQRYRRKPCPGTRCWWCKDLIVEVPIGVPVLKRMEDKTKPSFAISSEKYHMRMEGLFCDYPCACAYTKENFGSCLISEIMYNLRIVREAHRGISRFSDLKSAPDWRLLKIFGGPLSRDDFRSLCVSKDKHVMVEKPPIVLSAQEETVLLESYLSCATPLKYMNVPPQRPVVKGRTLPSQQDRKYSCNNNNNNNNNNNVGYKIKNHNPQRMVSSAVVPVSISSNSNSLLSSSSSSSSNNNHNQNQRNDKNKNKNKNKKGLIMKTGGLIKMKK
jgi:hypothetical protein